MKIIYNLIIWIKNNKIKFMFLDTILLIINIVLFNIINNGYNMYFEILTSFIGTNIFLCIIYFTFKVRLIITKKHDYLFISTGNIGKIITYFFISI